MKAVLAHLFGVICVAGLSQHALADKVILAQGYCYEMEGTLNALVEFTETKCIPSRGDKGMSFIFISSEPVFAVPDAKKAWLLAIVGVFRNTFNNNTMKSDEVWVSDMKLLKERVGFRMPSPTARKLQRQIKRNQIDLEMMYEGILSALREHHIKK